MQPYASTRRRNHFNQFESCAETHLGSTLHGSVRDALGLFVVFRWWGRSGGIVSDCGYVR